MKDVWYNYVFSMFNISVDFYRIDFFFLVLNVYEFGYVLDWSIVIVNFGISCEEICGI